MNADSLPQTQSRGWFEIAGAFALLECALWSARPAQIIWGLLLLSFVTLATIHAGRSTRELGLAGPGVRRGWGILPAAVLVAVLLLVSADRWGVLHDLHSRHRTLLGASLYIIWSFVQEFLAQAFILVRLKELLRDQWMAVMGTALLFSLAHIPNVALIAVTLCLGAALSTLFLRYRNLYVLGLAHALLGMTLAISMPNWAIHHMKVGLAYFGG